MGSRGRASVSGGGEGALPGRGGGTETESGPPPSAAGASLRLSRCGKPVGEAGGEEEEEREGHKHTCCQVT